MKEYKIDEEFVLLGHKMKVHAANDKCNGCFFYRKIVFEMGCMYRYLECVAEDRKDKTDVIFKKVSEGTK